MKARLVHRMWRWAAHHGTVKFTKGLARPQEAQAARLANILRNSQGSIFSMDHGLDSGTTLKLFRSRVPLRTWDELSPWREKVESGQQGVLTMDPVNRLIPTSGSSHGCKLVPTGRRLVSEFRAALDPWLTGQLIDEPALADGCSYWAISPPRSFAKEIRSGFPVGFEEDTAYFGPLASLASILQAVPQSVAREKTTHGFRQRTLSHLLRRGDLRFVSIWHPSFLELLLNHMEEHWESLLRIVSHGNNEWTGSLRKGDPGRARALRNSGPRPSLVWPHLSVVSAWCDGPSTGPSMALSARLPGAKLIPKGLVATEGITSIPWHGRRPLAITSHFLEFIDEAGNVLLGHQLEYGRRYEVVLTTSGGLWRLRTEDVVEVDGFVESTPSICFLGRQGGVVDLCGEKLNEIHVMRCLEKLNGILQQGDWRMLVPTSDGKGYLLLIDRLISDDESAESLLEQSLSENPHYAFARTLGQLRPVKIIVVPAGASVRVLERLVFMGGSHGATKSPLLDGRSDWLELLQA